jgi:DNA-binding beta-propeller fold protein YncE
LAILPANVSRETGDKMKQSTIAAALLAAFAMPAVAQLAVSANDGKVRMENGVVKIIPNNPDTVAIIDMSVRPPKLSHEIEVPASIVGPPTSVAISPDRTFALVTANMKLDPADPSKQIPDNRMSIIDLKANPPAVIGTVETGKGPAGVAIGPKGNIALVANREEGTVSVFAIDGKVLTVLGKVDFGNPKSGPSGISITPDGSTALVTRDGDSRISVVAIDRDKAEYTKRDMFPGQRPYGVEISRKGDVAVVANIGVGQGDADTISLIDMKAKPVRVVETVTVGQTPEGIAMSPDGKWVAVTVMNGSNKPIASPFYNALGLLKLFRVVGKKLVYSSQVETGVWTQGVVFSPDRKTLLVQNKEQRELQVLAIRGDRVVDTRQRIAMKNGGAGIAAR